MLDSDKRERKMIIFSDRNYLFLLLTMGFLAAAAYGSSTDELKSGVPFPRLVLPSIEDGSPMSIADFRGQKVILHIWASW